jgi:hypothetical protein
VLFDLLDRSSAVASLGIESHLLWELYRPELGPGWRSHAVGPEDLGPGEQRVVWWLIRRLAGDRRYLDKSPRNSLRVGYLEALFPDASFVFLKRDGRAVVSSLITGWRSDDRRFPPLPVAPDLSVAGYQGTGWKFVVPPGWESHASGSTLAEVCAFQWAATTHAILDAKARIPTDRWVEVAYEQLVATPREEARRVLERLGLPQEEHVMGFADQLPSRVSKVAVTDPRADKWREENPKEVSSILKTIEPMMARLGYSAER